MDRLTIQFSSTGELEYRGNGWAFFVSSPPMVMYGASPEECFDGAAQAFVTYVQAYAEAHGIQATQQMLKSRGGITFKEEPGVKQHVTFAGTGQVDLAVP